MHETTRQNFFLWLDNVLLQPLAKTTTAFHFNLYEYEKSVGIELMGTVDVIGAGADYWPGDATFYTDDERFHISHSVAGEEWPQWLETCKALIGDYINNGVQKELLRQSKGVGVGFVDGDMYLIWHPRK